MGKISKLQVSRAALTSAVSSLAILTSTPVAAAQPADRTAVAEALPVNIPQGPLSRSILAISDAFGVDILAPNELVANKTAPAVAGVTSAEIALDRALSGSGLTYASTDGAFVVTRQTTTALGATTVQPSGADTAANDRGSANEETIVVRGTFQDSLIDRLPLTVRELPFTLNTVTREDIDQRNFIRRIDVLDTLPNVQLSVDFTANGNPQFFVRGFVAPILVNNRVVNPVGGVGVRDDAFIERYEVLKGPASIALGPIAGGGVINAVTKQPEATDFTDLRFTTDQFGTLNSEFDFNNAQLFGSDRVGFRLSGAYRDFRFDAEEIERREFAVQGVFTADIGPRTDARLGLSYKDIEGPNQNMFALFNDGSIPENFDTDTFFGVRNGFQNSQDTFVDAQIVHEFLDNLQLTVRGSHQHSDQQWQDTNGFYNYLFEDGLAGIAPANPVGYAYIVSDAPEQNTDFVDMQLSYTNIFNGMEQSFVIGGSYAASDFTQFSNFDSVLGPIDLNQIDQPRFGNPENMPSADASRVRESELYSVYGEFALRPVEGLTIVGGLRFDDFEQTETRGTFFQKLRADELTYRVGGSYEMTPNINAFVSYAEAFTPQIGTRRDGSPVGPENSRNYEAGLKGRFFEGLVNFDLAAFSTDRINVAVNDPDALPTEQGARLAIGKQRNQGVEANLNLQTGTGLNIDISYGYLDQELVENLEDAQLSSVPDQQVSVFATYEMQTGPLTDLTLGGGLRHFSSRTSVTPGVHFPSVTVGDLFANYPLTETTAVSVNILNVTDELYLEAAGNNGTLSGQQNFGAPRTFVLSLRARF